MAHSHSGMVGTNQIEPEVLNLIRLLHPHPDGYISFWVESFGDHRGFAIRKDLLEKFGDRIPFRIEKDASITINAAVGCKGNGSSRGFGYPNLTTETLRYLCAAYCDIDWHEVERNPEKQILTEMEAREASGSIPPVSMYVRSGRGLWATWFLVEEKEGFLPPRAWPDTTIPMHRAIQNAVAKKLADLGADQGVLDAVRRVRLPGSLNTKSETVVEWIPTPGIPRYTLSELASRLGVQGKHTRPVRTAKSAPDLTPEEKQRAFRLGIEKLDRLLFDPGYLEQLKTKTAKAEVKKRGYFGLIDRRLRDLNSLVKLRGHLRTGCRNNAAYLTVILLWGKGFDQKQAEDLMDNFRRLACKPAMTEREALDRIKSVYSKKVKKRTDIKVSDRTIGKWLKITPEENALLEGDYLGIKSSDTAKRCVTDASRMQSRRAVILEIIADGKAPSTRQMAGLLKSRALSVSNATVSKDYKALGLNRR